MEGINEVISTLSEGGRLSRAIDGFQSREAQIQLAEAVAQTILNHKVLVAEAGTGTGKTFAYLLPALVSKKKVIVSTATKTLQDQLFNKDIPMLINALGLALRVQNLKGRANYICRYRVHLNQEEGRFKTGEVVSDFLYVMEQLPRMKEGDRSELPKLQDDSLVWPYVTSTVDNCLGVECEYFKECFLVKARKRAQEADLVVINHHLFFADLKLKDGGFGELLPGVDVIVFDEAHQLSDIALDFFGDRLSTRLLEEWMTDTMRVWPALDKENHPLKHLNEEWEQLITQCTKAFPHENERLSWTTALRHLDIPQAISRFEALILELQKCFSTIDLKENAELGRLSARLNELQSMMRVFEDSTERIRWVECFKHHLIFHATPYHVAKVFREIIQPRQAYVFTSATITVADSFDAFIASLGLEGCQTLLLPSPFDFKQQALLYFPRSMPDTKQLDYNKALLERALPIINAFKGRCFFLFTSHKALREMATFLTGRLPYPILVQGEESKTILLARFRELGNAVLLGTSTFWEGVDVKGDALSCVIIDKIPFASPSDPVVRGRLDYYNAAGRSGFDELSIPYAVLNLKQGVGRLIRDMSDKGVLMIADPRLTGRPYGQTIMASLPPMPKTRDESTVIKFIEALA